jgi:hypothetical protein
LGEYDDFSDPTSGWGEVATDSIRWSYTDGRYELRMEDVVTLAWAGGGGSLDDFVLTVDVFIERGPSDEIDENMYGVLFRYTDEGDFYFFAIRGNPPLYNVFKVEAGKFVPLAAGTYHIAPRGSAENLMVMAEGSQFSFYVNGAHLTDASDSAFARGGVALAGYSIKNRLDVFFDNFSVWVKR